jgi:hypothetical protein
LLTLTSNTISYMIFDVYFTKVEFILQTLWFPIKFIIKNMPIAQASIFYLQSILEIESSGIDLNLDDMLYNFIMKQDKL